MEQSEEDICIDFLLFKYFNMYICHMTKEAGRFLFNVFKKQEILQSGKRLQGATILRGFYYYFVCDSGNFFN